MISDKFVIVGAVLSMIGSSTYIRHTIQGKTKPNRVSFFMWAFAALVAFGAELHEHVGIQAFMTFVVGFSPLLIFFSSFVNKKSYWQITRFDLICGSLSLLGVILWLITRHGNIAIALTIAGDAIAGLPTFRKAFTHPETESYFLFLMAFINSSLVILTIKNWNFATYGFPIYIWLATLYLFIFVKFELGKKVQVKFAI